MAVPSFSTVHSQGETYLNDGFIDVDLIYVNNLNAF